MNPLPFSSVQQELEAAGTQIMEKDCKLCEKSREHYYQDHLNGKAVEFYELMHGEFSQHVRIPKKFTHCFRGEFSGAVDLKGPSGKIWPVGLKETNNGMLLQSGWKEFAEAHHIQESYLLVFKYDEKSCFDVSIFDENRCKKAACYLFMDSNAEERERNEHCVEVLNVKSRRKVDGHAPPGFHRDDMRHVPPTGNERSALKYQRTESSCKTRDYRHNELSVHPKIKKCSPCQDIGAQGTRYSVEQESVGNHDLDKLYRPNVYISRRNILAYEKIERASQLLHLAQPKNPCFISILAPGSVYNRCNLYVPSEFQNAHLPSESCSIVLQVPDQRKTWCADLFVYDSISRFCWESFVIDNSLHVGDACLFELADDPTDIVMTVSILRADDQDG